MSNIAVKLTNVGKKYNVPRQRPGLPGSIFGQKTKREFWALKNINLAVRKGEQFALIGPNGAGKTTLLKIIAGITTPTTGDVKTNGRVVSLINLEAGFHPDLNGRENLYLNGMQLGMGKREIGQKFNEIVDFADIGFFLDRPMFTYSSGMKLRLGFSIALHTNPAILVLDETFIFGDQEFMKMAIEKMKGLLNKGMSIILSSHYLDMLERVYDRIIWIEGGKTKKIGSARQTVKLYRSTNAT